MPTGALTWRPPSPMQRCCASVACCHFCDKTVSHNQWSQLVPLTASINFKNAFVQATPQKPTHLEMLPGHVQANPGSWDKVMKIKKSVCRDCHAANLWCQIFVSNGFVLKLTHNEGIFHHQRQMHSSGQQRNKCNEEDPTPNGKMRHMLAIFVCLTPNF